jgi:hypothetical protein
MSTTQRYISNELTHFVGANLRKSKNQSEKDKQYKLLIKILREGLLYNPKAGVSLVVNLNAKISKNEMYLPQMVCFSDIPVEDLTLHINKFSSFGVSFNKDFIVKQGGVPMHYIPAQSQIKTSLNITPEQSVEFVQPEGGKHLYKDITWGEYFDEVVKRYHKLFIVLSKLIFEAADYREAKGVNKQVNSIWDLPKDRDSYPLMDFPYNALSRIRPHINVTPGRDAIWYSQQLAQLQKFLDFHIFSFLKFFNHNLTDEHEKNYYFEREWRVVGRVRFDMEDVRRILIPERYSKQFRDDCPDYCGQVTFTEMRNNLD